MSDPDGRTHTIERLQSLLKRLTADDLTLAEAASVRAQVLGMLSDSTPSVDAVAVVVVSIDRGSSPLRSLGRSALACGRTYC